MITEIVLFKLPAGMSREEYSNWIPLSDHLHRVKLRPTDRVQRTGPMNSLTDGNRTSGCTGSARNRSSALDSSDRTIIRQESTSRQSRYVPLERLGLSPQCGFASRDLGTRSASPTKRRSSG